MRTCQKQNKEQEVRSETFPTIFKQTIREAPSAEYSNFSVQLSAQQLFKDMFHHHAYHQGKQYNFPFTGNAATPSSERILFSNSANVQVESGLVLSTDAKPRLKWTPELHERFTVAVNQLGGADKATPKTVMRIMGIPGLTLYHLKSHLQKYRLSKNLHGQTSNRNIAINSCSGAIDRSVSEMSGMPAHVHANVGALPAKSMQITEALHIQIEVQRRLHEQLEVQRHLQLRIEAQGKYLQAVLEKAKETLGRQNTGSAGLEAAKLQISELVSKVSSDYCFDSNKLESKDQMGSLRRQQCQIADCSMDSCLTTCDGQLKDQEMNDSGRHTRNMGGNIATSPKECRDDSNGPKVEESDVGRCQESKEWKLSPERNVVLPLKRTTKGLSLETSEEKHKQRKSDQTFTPQTIAKRPTSQSENNWQKLTGLTLPITGQLDLNSQDENNSTSSFEQFDLNGFSWS